MLAFRARYIFPIDSPPIRDGLVAIDHDRIIAVGPADSPTLSDFLPGARDLGDVAILPGLINSHTHLEFSDLSQPLGTPGMAFPDWIRLVVAKRRAAVRGSPDPAPPSTAGLPAAIAGGIAESTQCGVTAIGEIASTPWQRPASLPLEVTQFCEFISLRLGDDQRFQTAIHAASGQLPFSWSDEFRPGISPHAPYTVRAELIFQAAQVSSHRHVPLALHLAESKEELTLLSDGAGPLVQLLEDFGQWEAAAVPRNSKPMDYLQMLAEADRALVIHGNYLSDAEIGFLASHGHHMSVVYCPRTHAYFDHDSYPLDKMLAAGVNVAIGTDSRASSPDLSPLTEIRFAAAKHPSVRPLSLLWMITAGAASALGREHDIGTISAGRFADLAITTLPASEAADAYELLLDPACQAVATIFRGRFVYGANKLLSAGQLTPDS
jgi:cytosine/adenosine deaminase-related metal-dependent hydrolase